MVPYSFLAKHLPGFPGQAPNRDHCDGGPAAVATELGEVIGSTPGRATDEQITIYCGVGLAFQDAVAAWQNYQAALSRGAGREIDFLA